MKTDVVRRLRPWELDHFNSGGDPMHIGLLNMYSTRNLGDAAIYSALAAMSPGESVSGPLQEERPTPVRGLLRGASLRPCNGFVSVGGDIFNNARPRLVTRRFLQNVNALRAAPSSTMLFGQSIPRSCRNLAFVGLAQTLKSLGYVAVRDRESHDRLTAAGVRAELTFDTAFALPPQRHARAEALRLFAMAGLHSEKTILVSLRNQSELYAENGGEDQILSIAQALTRRGHQIGLLIQADGDSADSDRFLARRIQQAIPESRILDPFECAAPHEPWAVLSALLGLARAVVAVRYHAAVLRMVEGRQPFVLSYSNKGEDLCRRLNQPGSTLGAGDVSSLVTQIEASAECDFDAATVRADVLSHYSNGLSRIAA